MKFTYEQYINTIETKLEISSVIDNLFISRSVMGIKINDEPNLFFGFGSGVTKEKSNASAIYELLEHLVFLPYAHTDVSMNILPVRVSSRLDHPNPVIKSFFIGADGPYGRFTANGCAIAKTANKAIDHAKNELLERHTCSQIWYHRTLPLLEFTDFSIKPSNNDIKLNFYTTTMSDQSDKFGLVSLNCPSIGFFALGAAVRSTIEDALTHAASEAIMIFEDAKKGRKGVDAMKVSQQGILSLRNEALSFKRNEYINFIKNNPPKYIRRQNLSSDYVCFEPLRGVFAARAFSHNALDPKQFMHEKSIPILPLY